MNDVPIQSDFILAVVGLAAIIAAASVAVGVIAFRRNHGLIDRFERLNRRFPGVGGGADARVHLMAIAALLFWVAFFVCIAGLRIAISRGA